MNGKEVDGPSAVRELTGGLGVDCAFEVIGAPAVIAQAFLALKRGGKVVVVGVPGFGQDVTIPGFSLPLEEKGIIGSLYGSANLQPRHAQADRPLHAQAPEDRRADLAHHPLEDVNAAFEAMEKGEVARSVIRFS